MENNVEGCLTNVKLSEVRQIKRDEVIRHLDLLGASNDDEFWFQSFDDMETVDPDSPRKKKRANINLNKDFSDSLGRILTGDDRKILDRMEALNQSGAGIFVAVNEICGASRKKGNVARIRCVFAELDDGWPEQDFPIEPTFTVESSPGKYHAYWILDGELSALEFDGVMRRMIQDYGSDPSAKDRTRVLRVAGTWHNKHPEQPHLARITQASDRRYSREEIVGAFPPIENMPTSSHSRKISIALAKAYGEFEPKLVKKVRSAAAHLDKATDGDEFWERNTWLDWGMALHAESPDSDVAYELWCNLSEQYCPEKYDAKVQQTTWKSFSDEVENGITLGTIFHRAKVSGWEWNNAASEDSKQGTSRRTKRGGGLQVVRLSDLESRPIEWLWPGRIAHGKLSVLVGDPSVGKSQLTADIASRVTTGRGFPVVTSWGDIVSESKQTTPGSVLLIAGEDDPRDTILPRLEAAGADVSKVALIEGEETTDKDGNVSVATLSIRSAVPKIEDLVDQIGDVKAIIIDPISMYLGKTDSHNNSDIRAALDPIVRLATRKGIALICVSHLNKGNGQNAMYRVTGSLGLPAAARSVFIIGRDPADEEGSTRRLFLPVKNNLAEEGVGLEFSIRRVSTAQGVETSKVEWSEKAAKTVASEILGSTKETEDSSALEDATRFLKLELFDGWVESKELQKRAKGQEHAWATVRRAMKSLSIEASNSMVHLLGRGVMTYQRKYAKK